MKRILMIISCVALVVQSWAQFEKDEWGDIVPYSLSKEYGKLINSDALQSLKYPSFNNDSLCRANNNGKSFNELGNVFAAGFAIDSLINFKEHAKSFNLKEGTLWVLSIESPTANSLSIHIKEFDVPKGCYFAVVPGFMPYEINEPEVYVHGEIPKRTLDRGLQGSVDNFRMILEYFEPKSIRKGRDFMIDKINYAYAGGFGQRLKKTFYESKSELPNKL